MIRRFIILISLAISACSQGVDIQIFKEHIKSFEDILLIANKQNELIYNKFEYGMADLYYGNSARIKPWYEKAMSTKQIANGLINRLNQIETSLYDQLNVTSPLNISNVNKYIASQKVELNQTDISLLKKEFITYKNFIYSTVGNDSMIFVDGKNLIKNGLAVENWRLIPSLSGNKEPLLKTLAVLQKLRTSVRLSESEMIKYLNVKSDFIEDRIYKIAAIVEPNALIIPKGYSYTSNIFIGLTDSTINTSVFVEDKKINVYSGIANYREKVMNNTDTLVSRSGYFSVIIPNTNTHVKVPFNLEYMLVK